MFMLSMLDLCVVCVHFGVCVNVRKWGGWREGVCVCGSGCVWEWVCVWGGVGVCVCGGVGVCAEVCVSTTPSQMMFGCTLNPLLKLTSSSVRAYTHFSTQQQNKNMGKKPYPYPQPHLNE